MSRPPKLVPKLLFGLRFVLERWIKRVETPFAVPDMDKLLHHPPVLNVLSISTGAELQGRAFRLNFNFLYLFVIFP